MVKINDLFATNYYWAISSTGKSSSAESEGKLHPTQKPLKLFEYFINTYSNENDVILDIAMGSGTTGMASKNTNRNFIGIEVREEYFKITQERLS